MEAPLVSYLHRKNSDGLYESCCPICGRVVIAARSEQLLAATEQQHLCRELAAIEKDLTTQS